MGYKPLTDEQNKFIINNHKKYKYDEMAKILEISKSKIVYWSLEFKKQGLIENKPRIRKWTINEEKQFIELMKQSMPINEISNILHKDIHSLVSKIRYLREHNLINFSYSIYKKDYEKNFEQYKHTKLTNWTNNEIKLLLDNCKKLTLKRLCKLLNKGTWDILCQIRNQLKINPNLELCHNCSSTYFDFTEEEDMFLLKHIVTGNKHFILNTIHKNWKKMLNRMSLFGLKREFIPNEITDIEFLMQTLLEKYNIPYTFQKQIPYDDYHNYWADFYLRENIIIETMGDYWHGNPITQHNLNDNQKEKIKHDVKRHRNLSNLGYRIFYFWEYDLKNNMYDCENKLQFIKTLVGDKYD